MRFFIVLLCFAFFQTNISAQSTPPQGVNESAQTLLEAGISTNQYAGAAAGFSKDGKIKWQSAVGHSDLAEGKKMTTTTLLRPASIAKPMTAVAILQLYEAGLIDLDAPIQKYVPDFPTKIEGAITCRQLLQHTSGFSAYENGESQNKKEFTSTTEAAAVFQDRKLRSVPGKSYYYTTYGYVVLGLVIEKVSGQSYEAYMQKNIWDKVGMKNTFVEKSNVKYANRSALYFRGKNKVKAANKNHNISNRVPGGGLLTTIEDLLLFGQAILDNALISEATRALMWSDPGVRPKESGNGYSMGWFLYGKNEKHGMVYGHSGGQTGSSAQLFVLPDENVVAVMIANTSGSWQEVYSYSVSLFHLAAKSE